MLFGFGWKGEVWENLRVFLKKGGNKNCIIVKILFFSFLLQTSSERMGPISFLMCISRVPNSFKYFAFRTVLYKNVIALADVFPFSCQWKDVST